MTKIYEDEFNDIKKLDKAFKQEILYDSLHKDDPNANPLISDFNVADDCNLAKLNDDRINGRIFKNAFEEDNNILLAGNVYPIFRDDAVYVCDRSDFHGSPDPLNVAQLARIMDKLIKLGRDGIAKKADENADKRSKVLSIEKSMNL